MTNFDVSIRAKFVNQVGPGAKATKRDILDLKSAADKLGGASAGRLGQDLVKTGAGAKAAKRDILELKAATDKLGTSTGIQRFQEGMAKGLRDARETLKIREQMARQAEQRRRQEEKARRREAVADGGGVSSAAAFGAGALARRMLAPLGAAYGAKKALDASVDFEAAMAEVRKKVDVNSPTDLQELEGRIRRMALALGIARTEMAGLTAEAGASGIALVDIDRFMTLTGKAAIGWDMAPREASQSLAEIKTGLRMTIPDLEILADKINALGDNSAAKERDIVEMFQRSGAAAKAAGVDVDTTLAFLTGTKAMGIQAEIGARWWGVFSSRLASGFKGKQASSALKALGLDEKTLGAGMKSRPFETLMDFMERLEKHRDKVKIAKNLFGDEWFDETLRVLQGLDEIRKQRDLLRDPSKWRGSLEKGLDIQLGTTKNHFERLKVLASEVGDRLSRWALPPINDGIEWLIEKFDAITTKSTVFSKNMAYLEGRYPDWFGKKEAKPTPEKEPDNNPWLGIAGKRTSEASALQSEAEAARKEWKNAPEKSKTDKKRKAELKAEAERLERRAADVRRSAGMAAARDMTGLEEGRSMATGMRDRKRAEDRAWSDEVDALLFERGVLKSKVGDGKGQGRAALSQKHDLAKVDEKLRAKLGGADIDQIARLTEVFAGLAAQKKVATDPAVSPTKRVQARGNVERLEKELDQLKEKFSAGGIDEAGRQAMLRYIDVLSTEGDKAVEVGQRIADELKSKLEFVARPRIEPSVTGGGFGGESGPAAPASPGKQSSIGGPTTTVHQHIRGADPRAVARASQREQDRAVRRSVAGSLHDLGGSWA